MTAFFPSVRSVFSLKDSKASEPSHVCLLNNEWTFSSHDVNAQVIKHPLASEQKSNIGLITYFSVLND